MPENSAPLSQKQKIPAPSSRQTMPPLPPPPPPPSKQTSTSSKQTTTTSPKTTASPLKSKTETSTNIKSETLKTKPLKEAQGQNRSRKPAEPRPIYPQPAQREDSNPKMGRFGLSPGNPTLAEIARQAFDSGFSDIHLGIGEQPRMRDRGEMVITEYPETDYPTFMSWLNEVLKPDQIQSFQKTLEFDGAFQYDYARIRINVFDSLRGYGMVMRLIPMKILTLEQLRLPAVFKDISDAHKGLVLVTGPTGSGKSTTMAAMVDYINNQHAKHIISIEDPIEFVHKSRKSLIKQREVGIHTLKFDSALKASLREDPDVILVGEMRDKETVNTALKAAQTGHLVMGTLHTNSAVKTLERILSLYSAEEQTALRVALAESLVSIIAQGLCRTTDGKRAAYHDIMINTETIKDYVRRGQYDEITSLMEEGEFDGMITMNKSLFNLYQEGRITEETALERSPARNEMAMMLRGRI